MIVIDASGMVEALVGRNPSPELLDALAGDVHAPHLLDTEVLSALRGLVLGHALSGVHAEEAQRDHWALTIVRHEMEPLAERVWHLRHQFTAYDATYLALAEALNAPLYTCDAKLDAPGHSADVRLIERSR